MAETGTQSTARRWVVLAVGVLAQTSACSFVYGVPFLVPVLRDSLGISLTDAGWYVAAPTIGLLATLVIWGAAADRFGERWVITSGMAATGGSVAAVALTDLPVLPRLLLLGVGGAAAACVFAASGRMIMGWFPRRERGLAMGIRQTAQPLGVAVAGFALPSLAVRFGVFGALVLPAALCVVSAALVAAFAPDPPRAPAGAVAAPTRSPYSSPVLYRIHATSALLVVPQFAVAAFAAEYLVREQGWGPRAAGAFVATVQIAGAGSRIAAGWWSDRVSSRLRPMRQLAVGVSVILLVFAVGDLLVPWLAVAMLAVGGVVSVADNGLAYTSVAELAGRAWSGRALGIQNTGQNLMASLTPVALGALIGGVGYAAGFAVAAAAPLAAIGMVPVAAERAAGSAGTAGAGSTAATTDGTGRRPGAGPAAGAASTDRPGGW